MAHIIVSSFSEYGLANSPLTQTGINTHDLILLIADVCRSDDVDKVKFPAIREHSLDVIDASTTPR